MRPEIWEHLARAIAAVPVPPDAVESYEVLGRHEDGRIIVLVRWLGIGWYDLYEPMGEPDVVSDVYVRAFPGGTYRLVRSIEAFPHGFRHVAVRAACANGKPRKQRKRRAMEAR